MEHSYIHFQLHLIIELITDGIVGMNSILGFYRLLLETLRIRGKFTFDNCEDLRTSCNRIVSFIKKADPSLYVFEGTTIVCESVPIF